MRESLPIARYSPVCNVLRQWKTSLILTYRVYRLYDKWSAPNINPGADSSNLISKLNPVPIIPEKTPNNKYNVPISLWLVEYNQ